MFKGKRNNEEQQGEVREETSFNQQEEKPQLEEYSNLFELNDEDEEYNHGVEIQPITLDVGEVTEEKPKSKGKTILKNILLFGGIFAVALTAMIVLGQKPKQMAPGTETPTDIVGVPSDSEEGTTPNENTETDVDKDKENTDKNIGNGEVRVDEPIGEPVEPVNPTEGYVIYSNGYLDMQIEYPKDWIYYERTQEGFDSIRKHVKDGVLKLTEVKLEKEIPVADFFYSSDNETRIRVYVYPSTNKDIVSNKILPEIVETVKPETATKAETRKIGDTDYNINTYQVEGYGETYVGMQAIKEIGENIVLINLYDIDSEETENNIKVFETMLSTLTVR